MRLGWGTLLEQACANHAQACANQATAEATLLAMRRSQGEWHGQDGELDAWFSDAQGVAEVAKSLVRSQSGTKEECGRHQAHASLVCTRPRARISKAWHECEVYDIGEDGAHSTKCMESMLGSPLSRSPRSMIASCLMGLMLALVLMLWSGRCRGHQKATTSAQATAQQLRKLMVVRPNEGSG